jgi:hypothetical protein
MKKLHFGFLATLGLGVAILTIANSQNLEFKAMPFNGKKERVSGIYCVTNKNCVVSTSGFDGGSVYSSNGQKIVAKLIDGADTQIGQKVGLLGTLDFLGFAKAGDRIMVLANVAESFISGKADNSDWTVQKIGENPGGINQQMGFGNKDDRWVLFVQGFVTEGFDAPGPGALWSSIWSPEGTPNNFDQLWSDSKKTLCSSAAGKPTAEKKLQMAYVAPDLSILAYTTSGGSQFKPEPVGICLSNDGGKRFYRANLNLSDGDQAAGVTCISDNTCFTFSDRLFNGDTDYIYYTNDAQKLGASTWMLAKLPTIRERTTINSIFFAPDRKNGWAVGGVANSSPLLLSTTDGGATWKDSSSSVRAVASDTVLHSGFALDANNVWLGGKDVLITSSK